VIFLQTHAIKQILCANLIINPFNSKADCGFQSYLAVILL